MEKKLTITPKGGYFSFSPECKVHNDHDPSYADVERDPIPAADQQRMDDGVAREDAVSAQWAEVLKVKPLDKSVVALTAQKDFDAAVSAVAKRLRGRKSVWVPECDRSVASKRSREIITVAAMQAAVPFIWNCRLPAAGDRISEPDFLVRTAEKKSNNKFGYRPGDVKDASTLEGTAAAKPQAISTLDDYTYENASRRKLGAGKPKKKHSMQLAHYHFNLEALGYETAGNVWGAILGREGVLVWRNLSEKSEKVSRNGETVKVSILDYYLHEFARRRDVAIAAMDPEADALAGPELKSECKSCEFRTVCHDELVDSDHITLIPGITPARARDHYEAGIETRAALSRLDWKTAKVISTGCDVASLREKAAKWEDPVAPVVDLIGARSTRVLAVLEELGIDTVGKFANLHGPTATAYAGLTPKNLPDQVDAARVAKIQKVHLKRGVSKLAVNRADIELDVDMENEAGGIIYMWGTRLHIRNKSLSLPGNAYRAFTTWEKDDNDGEARAFAEMWDWIMALITIANNSGLTFKAYYYTGAENRCMRHLATKHAGTPGVPSIEAVEALIASEHWVDLYQTVSNDLVWPTEDLSLKSVAKWARHSWRDHDASGDSSTVWYRDAVNDSSDEKARAEAQQRLLDYNEDDVVATWVLREWLEKLASAREPGRRVPSVATLNTRFLRTSTRKRVSRKRK